MLLRGPAQDRDPVLWTDSWRVVGQKKASPRSRGEKRRLQKTRVVAHDVDGTERPFGPARRIENDEIEAPWLEALKGALLGAAAFHLKPGELAQHRHDVFSNHMDAVPTETIQREILFSPGERRTRKIHVPNLIGAAGKSTKPDSAGIGEEIENAFPSGVLAHAPTPRTQVEEQERILSVMARRHVIAQAELTPDGLDDGLSAFVGKLGSAVTTTMVPDQRDVQAALLSNNSAKMLDVLGRERLAPRLQQENRPVAIDGEAGASFGHAVKQSIAVGPLRVQLLEQGAAPLDRSEKKFFCRRVYGLGHRFS